MSDYEYEADMDEHPEDGGRNVDRFTLGTCLNAPRICVYTTKDLHKMLHLGMIDLEPPYQRDFVWSDQKQMKLIDSILHNYYVPPVVFAISQDDEGKLVRCCVDGKQRLKSIQYFFDGKVAYKHSETGKLWWYTCPNARRKSRLVLPDRYKALFANKIIHCVEYRNLPHLMERDLFQRVQLGVALTPAEKLQAISSPWSDWILDLQARYVYVEDSLMQKINVAVKRGQDFQLLSGLVYCCNMYPQESQPSSRNLDIWLSNMKFPKESFKNVIYNVLNTFWQIADDPTLNYPFQYIQNRVAPVEFIFIGVMIFVLQGRQAEEQAQAIYEMRSAIRKKHADVRLRSDIIRDVWRIVAAVVDEKSSQGRKKKRDADNRPRKRPRN